MKWLYTCYNDGREYHNDPDAAIESWALKHDGANLPVVLYRCRTPEPSDTVFDTAIGTVGEFLHEALREVHADELGCEDEEYEPDDSVVEACCQLIADHFATTRMAPLVMEEVKDPSALVDVAAVLQRVWGPGKVDEQ